MEVDPRITVKGEILRHRHCILTRYRPPDPTASKPNFLIADRGARINFGARDVTANRGERSDCCPNRVTSRIKPNDRF
jgi:hypothetical protein